MESPTDTFHRWQCHVTVRLSQFESLGHSVGKIVWKNSTSPRRCIFPNKMYSPSEIRSVYTDEHILSVYTDRISDGVSPSVYTDRFWDGISVGNSVGFLRFSSSDWRRVQIITNRTSLPYYNLHMRIRFITSRCLLRHAWYRRFAGCICTPARTSDEDDGKPSIAHAACIQQQIIHVKSMPPLFFHTHTHTLLLVLGKNPLQYQ